MTRQVLTTQASSAVDAFVGLIRSHALVTRELSSQLSHDHGLTISEYEALLRLFRAENHAMRRVDLAAELLLTPSGVTRLLDGLEEAGYVGKESCESDARVTYAVLTEAGKRKLARAGRTHVEQVRAAFEERFTEGELKTLAELLGRLSGGADDSESCEP
jgi:DNA-binding MarR family transcriptional regulator